MQSRKREKEIPKRDVVTYVGQQADNYWVLSKNVQLDGNGCVLSVDEYKYIWLGEVYNGPGIPPASDGCSIELPLTTDPLCLLIDHLRKSMRHNFMPAVLTMASFLLVMNYKKLLKVLRYCPIPLSFGASGTGKTTALLSGLSLFGAHDTRFYSKLSKEKILALCSSSGIPLAVDDPQSKSEISRLLIDLFNGAKHGTMARGEGKPKSTCVIAANFAPIDQKRLGINAQYTSMLQKQCHCFIDTPLDA